MRVPRHSGEVRGTGGMLICISAWSLFSPNPGLTPPTRSLTPNLNRHTGVEICWIICSGGWEKWRNTWQNYPCPLKQLNFSLLSFPSLCVRLFLFFNQSPGGRADVWQHVMDMGLKGKKCQEKGFLIIWHVFLWKRSHLLRFGLSKSVKTALFKNQVSFLIQWWRNTV